MNIIRGAFIFLAFAGLMTSPAFSNVEERIKFWNEFKKELNMANNYADIKSGHTRWAIQNAWKDFKEYLENTACAKDSGFRADLGLLCFNPKIQMIANFYCKTIIKTEGWDKTYCATAGKSRLRVKAFSLLNYIDKIKKINVEDVYVPIIKKDSSILNYIHSLEMDEYKKQMIETMKELDEELEIGKKDRSGKYHFCQGIDVLKYDIKRFCSALYANKAFINGYFEKVVSNDPSNFTLEKSKFDNLLLVQKDPLMKTFVNFLCPSNEYYKEEENFNKEEEKPYPIFSDEVYQYITPLSIVDLKNIPIFLMAAESIANSEEPKDLNYYKVPEEGISNIEKVAKLDSTFEKLCPGQQYPELRK